MQAFIFKLLKKAISVRISIFILHSLLFFGLTACQKTEVATRDYPRLRTLEVSNISSTGGKFSAEIISGNAGEVVEYGFVWSQNAQSPNLGNSDNTDIKGTIAGNTFSADVETLQNNKGYYLRSFIKTSDLLIYGRVVTFKTLQ
jgi:hypothetical protein